VVQVINVRHLNCRMSHKKTVTIEQCADLFTSNKIWISVTKMRLYTLRETKKFQM